MNILIVRLGALGDIVHAMPAAAALRAAMPDARIDWLVDAKHRPLLDLVTGLDRDRDARTARRSRRGSTSSAGCGRSPYDVALDLQGLMKSAVLARASGARRVVGFSIWHLREKTARPFYSDDRRFQRTPEISGRRVTSSTRTCSCSRVLGVETERVVFPLVDVESPVADVRAGRRRRRPVRADESRRRVAEQALAAGALRRGRDVPPRRPRAALGRALGARRGGARARRSSRRRTARRSEAPATRSPISSRSSRAAALCRVGRHRAAAHRRGRRHADRRASSGRPIPSGTARGPPTMTS